MRATSTCSLRRSAAVAALGLATALGLAAAAPSAAAAPGSDLAATPVDEIASSPAGVAAATARAVPIYQRDCAGCHGADRQGDAARGIPNLADSSWLWGDGTADSELQALVQTLRFGIRSANPKTRNVAAMPAYGAKAEPAQRLSQAQIDDLTAYVLRLSGQPHDADAARRGKALYGGAPNCFDCHSADGSGNTDWGATDLSSQLPSAFVYGRSAEAIRTSISEGRAGTCPDWSARLDDADLKSLAVWLRASAH